MVKITFNKNIMNIMSEDEILARTLYGEARGEGVDGQEAVACVIMNRVKKAKESKQYKWWGETPAECCLADWQFSCWLPDDPNREKLLAVTQSNQIFAQCLVIARRAIEGKVTDRTKGSTHYCTNKSHPKWSIGKTPCAVIGHHKFYNDVD